MAATAQQAAQPFRAHLYNDEFKVAMHIDFYDQNITIPGQELFGQMAGYLIKDATTYCWLVVQADIDDKARTPSATLLMSNDYGSEDCQAELTVKSDTLYVLRHLKGSLLKVPNKGKWQKLPKIIELKRKNKRINDEKDQHETKKWAKNLVVPIICLTFAADNTSFITHKTQIYCLSEQILLLLK